MTAFADALGALFSDPNLSVAALWKSGGVGAGVPVRIVLKQPDQLVNFGLSRAIVATTLIDVRVADVASPHKGDVVVIGGVGYEILADPRIDTLRLKWECEAAPV
jgi:hypothetical protein